MRKILLALVFVLLTTASAWSAQELNLYIWSEYMGPEIVPNFEKETGIKVRVDYYETMEDMMAKLQAGGASQYDLVVPTDYGIPAMIKLGLLKELDHSKIPNMKNVRPDLIEGVWDPGAVYSMPYFTGFAGLAYNKAATGRPVTKVEDLWDPAFKGRVSLLSDLQDGLGMVMLSQGNSPENPTTDSVKKAVDTIRENKDKGQIRKFTGNDYAEELASGNVVVAQAYSGDVVQLKADNPDIEFIVPEAGGTWFIDTMVIPYTTQNQKAAEAWIDYIYDRGNYAKLIATTQFVPVLSDMTDELSKIDPSLAGNQLINPPAAMLDNLKSWAAMTDEQTQEYNELYAAVTGG